MIWLIIYRLMLSDCLFGSRYWALNISDLHKLTSLSISCKACCFISFTSPQKEGMILFVSVKTWDRKEPMKTWIILQRQRIVMEDNLKYLSKNNPIFIWVTKWNESALVFRGSRFKDEKCFNQELHPMKGTRTSHKIDHNRERVCCLEKRCHMFAFTDENSCEFKKKTEWILSGLNWSEALRREVHCSIVYSCILNIKSKNDDLIKQESQIQYNSSWIHVLRRALAHHDDEKVNNIKHCFNMFKTNVSIQSTSPIKN